MRKAWFAILLVLVGVSCRPDRPVGVGEITIPDRPEETRETVVARIGAREITLGELDDRLNALPVFVRMRYQGADRRREFLDAYVQYVVLGLAAQEAGYDRDPAVTDALKSDQVERFLRDRVDLQLKTTDIPDEAIQAYYDRNLHEFRRPEQVRVMYLRVPDRETADKLSFRLRKKIERTAISPLEEFATVAKVAGHSGDLGWFPRVVPLDGPALDPELLAAVGELKEVWDVGAPVLTSEGFHVLMLAERRPAVDRTFDQAKPEIVTTLIQAERDRRRAELMAELRKNADVRIDEEAVRRVAAAVRSAAAESPAARKETP